MKKPMFRKWNFFEPVRLLSAGVLSAGVTLFAGPVAAHPHVWVEMRSELLVSDDGKITGVRMEWKTDPAYATTALEGLDANADGNYDKEELARLTDENLSALADYKYFAVIRLDGTSQDTGTAIDGMQVYDANEGRLTLQFTVPLKSALDPHAGKITLKIYDPEFFIAFNYVDTNPLLVSKDLPQTCSAALLPLQSDAEIEQTRLMLASKDRDWKPETADDYGAMFAQAAEVKCAS